MIKPYQFRDSPGPGGAVLIEAGGQHAMAIPVDGAALHDPATLHAAVATGLGVALDPQTVKKLTAISGVLKDTNTGYGMIYPGQHLPVGEVLDGLAIITSSVSFMQAIQSQKSPLRVSLAGAEMVANMADAFIKTPATTMVAMVIRNVNRLEMTFNTTVPPIQPWQAALLSPDPVKPSP